MQLDDLIIVSTLKTGKMRAYRVGKILKTRYEDLMGPLYIPNAVYATSTDFDRTKMSLQIVLAGLFPPSELQMWNPEFPWMPIPIHYTPEPLDTTMKGELCPELVSSFRIDKTARLYQRIVLTDVFSRQF